MCFPAFPSFLWHINYYQNTLAYCCYRGLFWKRPPNLRTCLYWQTNHPPFHRFYSSSWTLLNAGIQMCPVQTVWCSILFKCYCSPPSLYFIFIHTKIAALFGPIEAPLIKFILCSLWQPKEHYPFWYRCMYCFPLEFLRKSLAYIIFDPLISNPFVFHIRYVLYLRLYNLWLYTHAFQSFVILALSTDYVSLNIQVPSYIHSMAGMYITWCHSYCFL